MLAVLTLIVPAPGCGPPPPEVIPADLASRMEPTFSSIQRQVLDPYCAREGCHTGTHAESLLSLRRGAAYRGLVGVPSVQIKDLLRVEPGRADRSYLIRKLEGDSIVGEAMPRDNVRLPPDAIDVIRRWIDAGAPDD